MLHYQYHFDNQNYKVNIKTLTNTFHFCQIICRIIEKYFTNILLVMMITRYFFTSF